jgi:DEAD/DEAH box helicase domain-containing protein
VIQSAPTTTGDLLADVLGVRPVDLPPGSLALPFEIDPDLELARPDTLRWIERIPARSGNPVPWPEWVPAELRNRLQDRGIDRPWSHQAATAELAASGRHVVVATGTASGKSLGYQLPVLTALLERPRATALYLSPTKALAADQLRSLEELGLPGVRPAGYDGDTPLTEREWVRDHARLVLTNPDMLHHSVLPQHARWRRLFRGLQYVVIDECHAYRGLFGSHVALVLRRLRRIAALYGASPVFVFASATVADPGAAATRLLGDEVEVVGVDGAPRAGADFVLWEPPVVSDGAGGDDRAPRRRPAAAEAADLLARLVHRGARTLAFTRSRHGAEQAAISARRQLSDAGPLLRDLVEPYRGGYLPEERRDLERRLASGDLLGLATTNALELGVDIAGLDAVVLAGFPGSIASVWQQAGRAGRGRTRALVVFVARNDPLDTYLVHHPEAIFGRPVEAAVTDPANARLLRQHLECAAAEHHLCAADLDLFGGENACLPVISDMVRDRVLRVRPTGWYQAIPGHPADAVDLRGSGGQVLVVEADTGRLLGTVDAASAPGAVHPGAVHLHRGTSYLVDELDLDAGVALVHAAAVDWTTSPLVESQVHLLPGGTGRNLARGVRTGVAPAEVTSRVIGYRRRRPGGELLDSVELEMPEHCLTTRALWFGVPPETLLARGLPEAELPGALHAVEHAAIALLPLYAGCDRSDVGGLSTMLHPDTGLPTVLIHDGFPGGVGFADRGHQVMTEWLTAVRDAIRSCGCRSGCPGCVQSPTCASGNHPLAKAGAVVVLDAVVAALTAG